MPKDDIQRGQNYPVVILVTILYIAILLSVITSKDEPFDNLVDYINTLSLKEGVFAFFTPVVSLILGSAFARNLKEMLVFWKLEDVLPGHRAFTKIIHEIEPRVVEGELRDNMLKNNIIDKDELPNDPVEQNAAWYKIYLKYKKASNNDVLSRSRDSISLRDSASVGFMFFLFGTLGLILTNTSVKWIPIYGIVSLLLYILLSRSATNMANNLVHYVLYKYSTSKD